MQLKDTIFLPTGHVKVTLIKGSKPKLIYDNHNEILPAAKPIIIRSLAGFNFEINQIKVFKAAVLLATSTSLSITFPTGNDKVVFLALFNEASFNDTFDELRLNSSNGGDFSRITGLSILKDDSSKLQVEWRITLNNI